MADIFLSYSKADRDLARKLVKALESLGWSVFMDRKTPISTTWDEYIEEELDRARSVLVLWTVNSVGSRFVKLEARDGWDREIYVPVQVGDPRLPFQFRDIQAASLDKWDGNLNDEEFSALVRALERILGAASRVGSTQSRSTTKTKDQAASAGMGRSAIESTSPVAVRSRTLEVPEIEWVEIPSGAFHMGSTGLDLMAEDNEKPQHDVTLSAFRISKYPITNDQFRAFSRDGGYLESSRDCWTAAGWKWKGDRRGPNDGLAKELLNGSHPRVNITWFEAMAFSGWLSEKLGFAVRLPNEREWEKAARGTDGRIYPWGNEFDHARCNSVESGREKTTPVDRFDDGQSPYGVYDMSGNVEEWCMTTYVDSCTIPPNEDPDTTFARVVRGGSFVSDKSEIRCAWRLFDTPDGCSRATGFRVVVSGSL